MFSTSWRTVDSTKMLGNDVTCEPLAWTVHLSCWALLMIMMMHHSKHPWLLRELIYISLIVA